MAGKRWNQCNVFAPVAAGRRLWQFDAKGGGFKLARETTLADAEPLPPAVQKNWSNLWQPRLNVACLPTENVFLRAAQFPAAAFEETFAMVELQLEKLSPLPVGQIVWSLHCLPHPDGKQQTVLLTIVERAVVEEFLGWLETQGFLADRLELPALDTLLGADRRSDGAWVYPELLGGVESAVVAWWFGGVLRSLDLVRLPAGADRTAALREQLSQMAWAGQIEGWLTGRPEWHLVAPDSIAAAWEAPLRAALDTPVRRAAPLPPAEGAQLLAARAASGETRAALLPPEFTTRYHQRFVDGLWMRGVGALVVLYLAGLAIYFAAVGVAAFRTGSVERDVAQLSQSYTNALQLRDRFGVLKERQELKFAALDSWKAVAEQFPEGVTLETFTFRDGRQVLLSGTAPGDDMSRIIDFHDSLKRIQLDGRPFFDVNAGEAPVRRAGAGNVVSWNFSLELLRTEVK